MNARYASCEKQAVLNRREAGMSRREKEKEHAVLFLVLTNRCEPAQVNDGGKVRPKRNTNTNLLFGWDHLVHRLQFDLGACAEMVPQRLHALMSYTSIESSRVLIKTQCEAASMAMKHKLVSHTYITVNFMTLAYLCLYCTEHYNNLLCTVLYCTCTVHPGVQYIFQRD